MSDWNNVSVLSLSQCHLLFTHSDEFGKRREKMFWNWSNGACARVCQWPRDPLRWRRISWAQTESDRFHAAADHTQTETHSATPRHQHLKAQRQPSEADILKRPLTRNGAGREEEGREKRRGGKTTEKRRGEMWEESNVQTWLQTSHHRQTSDRVNGRDNGGGYISHRRTKLLQENTKNFKNSDNCIWHRSRQFTRPSSCIDT